ncbi:hypothetical protein [Nannocystis pusilla]|uniref:Uncharacterized protein n=1 Tax=Nannocystis pusilla TaxID=889268 RepID=A0ABS7TMT4_9BACT|nr:hypothetical protein [Nannocystis pusilla]MBZ5709527.1 hypothetical protein [Nannocystis pusilla]
MLPLKEYLEPGSLPYRDRGPRFLMSRPQPLGLLPTLWFWRELRTERPVLSMLVGSFMAAFSMGIVAILQAAGGSLPVVFAVAMGLPYLALGIVERGLRWVVLRRRRALAQGSETPAIEPVDAARES